MPTDRTITKSMKMKSNDSPAASTLRTALTAEVPSSASSITALEKDLHSPSRIRRMILRLRAESS